MTAVSSKVPAPESGPLLRIRDLKVDFSSRDGSSLRAVRGLDIELSKGEVLGIVGESGSGKSLGMCAWNTALQADNGWTLPSRAGHATDHTRRTGLRGRYRIAVTTPRQPAVWACPRSQQRDQL